MKNFFERIEKGVPAKEMVVFAAGAQTGKTMLTQEWIESYFQELRNQCEAKAAETPMGLTND